MLSEQQKSDLILLHDVEAEGEVFFSTLRNHPARSETERDKFALMVQVERETKTRIRSCLTRHCVVHTSEPEVLIRAQSKAKELAETQWHQFIRWLRDEASAYVALCRDITARGATSTLPTLMSVLAHEEAFLLFCTLELSNSESSAGPLVKYLQQPLTIDMSGGDARASRVLK